MESYIKRDKLHRVHFMNDDELLDAREITLNLPRYQLFLSG